MQNRHTCSYNPSHRASMVFGQAAQIIPPRERHVSEQLAGYLFHQTVKRLREKLRHRNRYVTNKTAFSFSLSIPTNGSRIML